MRYALVIVTALVGVACVVLAFIRERRSAADDERSAQSERVDLWLMLAGGFALVAALVATAWHA